MINHTAEILGVVAAELDTGTEKNNVIILTIRVEDNPVPVELQIGWLQAERLRGDLDVILKDNPLALPTRKRNKIRREIEQSRENFYGSLS